MSRNATIALVLVTVGSVVAVWHLSTDEAAQPDHLTICSFNIQFLGHYTSRDHQSLADLMAPFDIVVVQELVAPPYPMDFPDGTPVNADEEARAFFDAMRGHGFAYWLSEEDTGKGSTIHTNGTGTEWWVVFFKPDRVDTAADLPLGFLAQNRAGHPDYDRVPYAFAFRTPGRTLDFVLVDVHLRKDGGQANRDRRRHELASVAAWIDAHDTSERDFIVLGDMNIQNAAELPYATPAEYVSLNGEAVPTNTNVNGPRPYDHVMYRRAFTTEMDEAFDVKVVDLIKAMRPYWRSSEPYPGDPYVHDAFRQRYSDHHPVVFRLIVPEADDDGPAAQPVTVYVTPTGSKYHLPGCHTLGENRTAMTLEEAKRQKYDPCGVCRPPE